MSALANELAEQTEVLMEKMGEWIRDLDPDDLHALPQPDGISIGSHAWHVFRTTDNIVRFAFYREQPVWLEQGLDERWSLPKVNAGNGMPLEENQALRFPPAADLAQYGADVSAAAVPAITAMEDEFLNETIEMGGAGGRRERRRAEVISAVLLAHGNQHLGQIDLIRQMLGRSAGGV